MTLLVPNRHPAIPPTSTRLAVIGDAPSADDLTAGEPFVGTSGRYLRAILSTCGASTQQTFFGNICQHLPPKNDIENFDFNGPEIQSGIVTLKADLETFRPNCLLLLGKTAFRVHRPDLCYPSKRGYVIPLSDWRGSLYRAPSHLGEWKSVCTYHPSHILRSYNDAPFFKFDVARGIRHAASPDLQTITRLGVLRPTLAQVLTFIAGIRAAHTAITFDIEGYPDTTGVTMLSIVPTADPTQGIVIPFQVGGHYWGEDEEWQVWKALADLLADDSVPKTCHNCFYELFVLAWRHRMVVNNLSDDTMMAHWELYPDFAKGDKEERQKVSATQRKRSLGVCCSLYTEQPYYKDDRLSDDHDVKLNYNFLDSSVTAEVRNNTERQLVQVPNSFSHYRFNISIIPAYNYIMLRGCQFDARAARSIAESTQHDVDTLAVAINRELEERGAFGSFPCASEKKRTLEGFNVKSSKQKCWLLYEHLQCKPLKRWGITSDEDAMLHFWAKTRDPLLRLVIRCVRKRTRLSDIVKLLTNPDGRIRTGYDIVGTNTGRLASRNSTSMVFDLVEGWVNTGTNLQNVTKDLRVCFTSDSPEHSFFQADLSGADAWTVAAELSALGHHAMWDDLTAKIKPSLVLCLMVRLHAAKQDVTQVNRMTSAELKLETTKIKQYFDSVEGKNDEQGRPLDWLYLCSKRVQHGSNYGMHATRTAELVFGDSDGTIDLPPKDAELYQYFYKLRYKTDVRNDWIRKTLQASACIVSSCGVRRHFFAIRDRRDIDDAVVREASAFNPQCNTTYATNAALRNLWYDEGNRTSKGGLFVEPLIQVHDALCGQYRTAHQSFVAGKLKSWFDIPMTIAGTKVTIPVDAKYGPNWKDTKHPLFT